MLHVGPTSQPTTLPTSSASDGVSRRNSLLRPKTWFPKDGVAQAQEFARKHGVSSVGRRPSPPPDLVPETPLGPPPTSTSAAATEALPVEGENAADRFETPVFETEALTATSTSTSPLNSKVMESAASQPGTSTEIPGVIKSVSYTANAADEPH